MQQKILFFSCMALFSLCACAAPTAITQPTTQAGIAIERASAPTSVQECPSPDSTVDFAPQFFGKGLGQSPVWAVFSDNGRIPMSMITNRPQTEHGASIKLLLIVERTLTDIVTVEGNNLQTGEPLWFIVNGEQATTTLRLDPE